MVSVFSSSSLPPDVAGLSEALREWFAGNARDLPWRRTRDPYAILVSELMLQQTQVATVIPYFERWMRRFPDWAALAAAAEAEVLKHWEGLGYYARARNLHRAAQAVAARLDGTLPADWTAIRALPGVGDYTAGAVASFAFGLRAPLVDANVARVLSRLMDLAEPVDSPAGLRALWAEAERLLPADGEIAREHNAALMELGAVLCRPGEPPCLLCPARCWCAAYARGTQVLRPVKRPRRQVVELAENCGWIHRGDQVLLEQSRGPRWKGLWRLPLLGRSPAAGQPPLATATYPFTHHRVTLRVFAARAPRSLCEGRAWVSCEASATLAMTSPHRKMLERLLRFERPNQRSDARFIKLHRTGNGFQ